jgi:hypothetical protein
MTPLGRRAQAMSVCAAPSDAPRMIPIFPNIWPEPRKTCFNRGNPGRSPPPAMVPAARGPGGALLVRALFAALPLGGIKRTPFSTAAVEPRSSKVDPTTLIPNHHRRLDPARRQPRQDEHHRLRRVPPSDRLRTNTDPCRGRETFLRSLVRLIPANWRSSAEIIFSRFIAVKEDSCVVRARYRGLSVELIAAHWSRRSSTQERRNSRFERAP